MCFLGEEASSGSSKVVSYALRSLCINTHNVHACTLRAQRQSIQCCIKDLTSRGIKYMKFN